MSGKGYHKTYVPQHKGFLARARKAFAEYYPNQWVCELCGTYKNRFMQIHHIDGDYENNHPLNLLKLCKTCHDDIHYNETMQEPIISKVPVLS